MSKFPIRTFILPAVFILILFAGGFFYLRNQKAPVTAPSSPQKTAVIQSGVAEAQTLAQNYPKLIRKTSIQQTIQGVLTSVEEKSWGVESGGETLVLKNEGNIKVRYARLPKEASLSGKPVTSLEIKPEELKIGNSVTISRMIDWQTGASFVAAITVLP